MSSEVTFLATELGRNALAQTVMRSCTCTPANFIGMPGVPHVRPTRCSAIDVQSPRLVLPTRLPCAQPLESEP